MANQKNQKQAQDNRAFNEMLKSAKKRLEQRPPDDLARKTGVIFAPKDAVFTVPSLGRTYPLTYPEFECKEAIDEWFHLVLLHYMDLADETPVSDAFVPFADQQEGLIRGTKFDHTAAQALRAFLTGRRPEQVKAALQKLDAAFVPSNADLCAVLTFLPFYPIALKIWFDDDEFPPEGKLLLSKSASHYLTIEDAVVAGEFILRELETAVASQEKS